MTLTFKGRAQSAKTTRNTDVVEGQFVKLVPETSIVQQFNFRSSDPAFAGTMTMSWTFTRVPGGTIVTVTAEGVPPGISPDDHRAGMNSSLENLAGLFAERA